jgi:RNA polymerase sigma-70 factor, ECF subfamily
VDLAFRMLGDVGAAEDVVQDAFSRLMRADLGEVEDARGWLIVVTSRLCLDLIRSAHSRRERAHDASQIEYVAADPARPWGSGALADPADKVTFDDSVRLALLVRLERLSPAERVVFVLHDVFGIRSARSPGASAGRFLDAGSSLGWRGKRSPQVGRPHGSTSGTRSVGSSQRSSSLRARAGT